MDDTQAIERCIELARAAGAVELTVPTRRAVAYYLRLGFEETATYLKRKLTGAPRPDA